MSFERAFVRVFDGNPLQGGKFAGTAFFFEPTQRLLTANHVVRNCQHGAFLQLPDGDVLPIALHQIESCTTTYGQRDIAILHIDQPFEGFTPISLAERLPHDFDTVKVCGFFDASQSLHQRQTNISGYVNVQHAWNLAGSIPKGMSGGAVIRDGELVGLIYARDADKNIAYCIPVDEIRACLGETLTTGKEASSPELQRAATVFVGRHDELAQLKTALLGNARSPIAITALHGMAGVGKSWLADHFFATHRQHFPGGYQRLTLDAENPTSADLLLTGLAETLQISTPRQALIRQVQARLQQPRVLVHIENIDSDAAATVAAQFCQNLPECAIVLSGRLDNFGTSQRWQQVSLKPFLPADALAQLTAELAWLNAPAIAATDADRLVQVLGGLPLAIHLAAGYLAAGYGVDEFLHELLATGFDLPPEDATDGLFTRDQARAVLHSTFQISLRLLKTQMQKRLPDADKHFSHLGFAPQAGFGLNVAVIMTNLQEPEALYLLRQAARLGLLEQPETGTRFWKIHPLLATYLCKQDPEASAWQRLHEWIYLRLPEPKAQPKQAQNTPWENLSTKPESSFLLQRLYEHISPLLAQPQVNEVEVDYTYWRELSQESEAVAEWLESVPDNLTTIIAQTSSAYAIQYGPFSHWSAFCQRALLNGTLDDAQRANILDTLMRVARSCGDMDIAQQAAEEKIELDTFWGREKCAVTALGMKADILQARGQLDEALRIRTEDQLPVYERLGEVRSIAITKGQIADILQCRRKLTGMINILVKKLPIPPANELDTSLQILLNDVLPTLKRLKIPVSMAITQSQIADIFQVTGKLDEALRIRQQEVLPVFEQLSEKYELLVGRAKLALLYLQRQAEGDNQQAKELLHWSLQAAREMQIPEAEEVETILQHFSLEHDKQPSVIPAPQKVNGTTPHSKNMRIQLFGVEVCHQYAVKPSMAINGN